MIKLNYVEKVTFVLAAELHDCEPDLVQLYALLALTKGRDTTLADVHDAWALWRMTTRPDHPAIIPFDELHPDTQELDRPYMEAIHRAGEAK